MLKIPVSSLETLFSIIASDQELYLPIEKNGHVQIDKWAKNQTVRLDKLNTEKSAKDLFFPQSENMVAFKMEGKNISIIDNRNECAPFVMFGVRPCDVASFEILDKVFLSDPVDTYYKRRRDNGTIITLACTEPEETCFCSAFGIDPSNPRGDVATWIADDTLYWESQSKKGDELTKRIENSLMSSDSSDDDKLTTYRTEIKEILDQLPLRNLNFEGFNEEALNEKFNSPKWEELSKACIGCGTCTFVCPTCQCYDIRDYNTGHGIQRFRCWDSCMYSDFTKMAAENPRHTQVERFRQRFMHKLIYFPANNDGAYGCVGCGRCISKCPVSMNIVKVMKALGGNENE